MRSAELLFFFLYLLLPNFHKYNHIYMQHIRLTNSTALSQKILNINSQNMFKTISRILLVSKKNWNKQTNANPLENKYSFSTKKNLKPNRCFRIFFDKHSRNKTFFSRNLTFSNCDCLKTFFMHFVESGKAARTTARARALFIIKTWTSDSHLKKIHDFYDCKGLT